MKTGMMGERLWRWKSNSIDIFTDDDKRTVQLYLTWEIREGNDNEDDDEMEVSYRTNRTWSSYLGKGKERKYMDDGDRQWTYQRALHGMA